MISLYKFIPFRGIDSEEVLDEEVVALVLAKGLAHGVMNSREDDKLEVLVCFYQGIHHLVCARRIDIVIHLTYHQHKGTLELVGILHIAALHITGVDGITHPLLIPPNLVHAVVMTSATAVGCLVEITMEQYRRGTLLPTG